MRTLWDLWQDAARAILKKPVRVDFEYPAYKGASGEAALLKGGRVHIRINPQVREGEARLRVFLHECGHALNHSLAPEGAGQSLDIPPGYSAKASREVSCDDFAARILALIPKSRLQGIDFEEHALEAIIRAGKLNTQFG